MGVTVHYEGQLKDRSAYDAVIDEARRFAEGNGWSHQDISEEFRRLSRVRNERDWDYEGPTKGIELFAHENCEPIRLEFDRDLYVQEYTKTQFAPLEVHVALVELLRRLASHFVVLNVEDEGEYYESNDRSVLSSYIEGCNARLEQILVEEPNARARIKLPSGRIVDLIS